MIAELDVDINRANSAHGGRISVSIGDLIVDPVNIKYLVVREWAFDNSRIPRLELIIMDDGAFTDLELPHQGKIIELNIIKDKSDNVEESSLITLKGKYKIIDFEFQKSNSQQAGASFPISITALLDIPNIFNIAPNVSYENKDSKTVLKSVASEFGLEFTTNIAATSDSMNWLRINSSPLNFIQHVVERSFISESDAALCYINKDKQLNYISINSAFSGEPIKCKYNLHIALSNTIEESINRGKSINIEENEVMNSIWMSSYSIKNFSNSFELLNGGFSNNVSLIDISTGSWSVPDGNSYPEASQKSSIIEVDNHAKLISTELDPNKTSFNGNRFIYNGILPGTIKYSQNVYGIDYYHSKTTRKNVLSGLLGMPTTIEINSNMPISIGDILDVDVPASVHLEEDDVSEILSGNYIVLGILYVVDNGFFKKILSIHRIGFNKNSNI